MNKTGLIAKISIKYVLPTCIWKYFWRISRYFAFFGNFAEIPEFRGSATARNIRSPEEESTEGSKIPSLGILCKLNCLAEQLSNFLMFISLAQWARVYVSHYIIIKQSCCPKKKLVEFKYLSIPRVAFFIK